MARETTADEDDDMAAEAKLIVNELVIVIVATRGSRKTLPNSPRRENNKRVSMKRRHQKSGKRYLYGERYYDFDDDDVPPLGGYEP